MKRNINITRFSWKWTILLLVGLFVAMYGYSQNAGAGFNTQVDPPGACVTVDEDFITEDGGCKDLATGIVWSADTYGHNMSWSYVMYYCDNLEDGGYTDWVMPTKDELIDAALNGADGHLNIYGGYVDYWSSDEKGKIFAWLVNLSTGATRTSFKERNYTWGLCNRHPSSGGNGAPSDLIATAVSATQIDLTWTDKSSDEEGFEIERSSDGVNWPSEPTDTVGPNIEYYSDEGLTNKTTYYYRVRAYGLFGYSDYSNTASAKTKNR